MRSPLAALLSALALSACSPSPPAGDDDDDTPDAGARCVCGEADGCCPASCELVHDPDCPDPACQSVGEELREVRTINPPPNGNGAHMVNIAWSGAEYGIVWYGRFDGAYFARADADGELVPGSIVHLQRGGLFPRIEWNGEHWGVVYSVEDPDAPDPFVDREIHFALLDADGQLVTGTPVQILGPGRLESPALAWNPHAREWAIVWEDGDQVRVGFLRLGEDGWPIAGSERRIDAGDHIAYLSSSGATTPILWAGDSWVVTWAEDTGAEGLVGLARIGPDGQVASTSMAPTSEQPFHPAAVWTGSTFAVTWTEYAAAEDRFAVHLATAGADAVFDATPRTTWLHDAGHAMTGTASWDGRHINVVWWSELDGDNDIWLARVVRDGTVDEHIRLTDVLTDSWAPFLIWDGCQHVVSYQVDATGSEGRLVFIPPPVIEIL